MIKTIIFDLGGVIVPFDFMRGYKRMSALCGLETTEIRERISAAGLVPQFETGKIQTNDFVRQLTGVLGFEAKLEDFAELWSVIFEPHTLIPESLLESLRGHGYRILLLSNTNDLHIRFIRERYPLLRHFHHQILSFEVGAMKPSPEIYAEAIRHAGCAPHECFFTDDVPAYVEGAKAAGIDAVQFQSYEQIRAELTRRQVSC